MNAVVDSARIDSSSSSIIIYFIIFCSLSAAAFIIGVVLQIAVRECFQAPP